MKKEEKNERKVIFSIPLHEQKFRKRRQKKRKRKEKKKRLKIKFVLYK